MSIHHTSWHALTVTKVWHCGQADPDALALPCRDEDGWCTGHSEGAAGRKSEIQHDLSHPADCESRPDYLDCLTADFVCNAEQPLPAEPGAYRVRVRMRLPGESPDGIGANLECEAAQDGGAP